MTVDNSHYTNAQVIASPKGKNIIFLPSRQETNEILFNKLASFAGGRGYRYTFRRLVEYASKINRQLNNVVSQLKIELMTRRIMRYRAKWKPPRYSFSRYQSLVARLRAGKHNRRTRARDVGIVAERHSGLSLREIGRRFGLSHTQIANICRRMQSQGNIWISKITWEPDRTSRHLRKVYYENGDSWFLWAGLRVRWNRRIPKLL